MGNFGASISGLQSSQRWLDVISNNVANSQTVAYKNGRVNFADLVSRGLSGASGSTSSNLGGINPSQLGMGVTVQTIQTLFKQGSLQVTGNATDLAIQGSGFFAVSKGDAVTYSRAGNFTFDAEGNFVNASGGIVQGWMGSFDRSNDPGSPYRITAASYSLNAGDPSSVGNVKVPRDLVMAPQPTGVTLDPADKDTGIIIRGNLDEKTPGNATAVTELTLAGFITSGGAGVVPAAVALSGAVDVTAAHALLIDPFSTLTPDHLLVQKVYDSVGDPRSITFQFYQVGDTVNSMPPQFAWYAFDTTKVAGSTVLTGQPNITNLIGGTGVDLFSGANWLTSSSAYAPPAGVNPAYGFITFNADGSLQSNGGTDVPLTGGTQGNPVLAIVDPLTGNINGGPVTLPSGGVAPFIFSVNFGTPNTWDAVPIPVPPALPVPVPNGLAGGFGAAITSNGLRDGLTGDYGGGTTDQATGVYTPKSTAFGAFQDGYSSGLLTDIAVDRFGTIIATFSNDQSLAVAQLALAEFTNEAGLERVGSNEFQQSANSGQARYGIAATEGRGSISGGALEMSSVDLSVELTNMILAQRMFESNARAITAGDELERKAVDLAR